LATDDFFSVEINTGDGTIWVSLCWFVSTSFSALWDVIFVVSLSGPSVLLTLGVCDWWLVGIFTIDWCAGLLFRHSQCSFNHHPSFRVDAPASTGETQTLLRVEATVFAAVWILGAVHDSGVFTSENFNFLVFSLAGCQWFWLFFFIFLPLAIVTVPLVPIVAVTFVGNLCVCANGVDITSVSSLGTFVNIFWFFFCYLASVSITSPSSLALALVSSFEVDAISVLITVVSSCSALINISAFFSGSSVSSVTSASVYTISVGCAVGVGVANISLFLALSHGIVVLNALLTVADKSILAHALPSAVNIFNTLGVWVAV